MTSSSGFWSYVHKDDDAEGGRIVRLVHDVVAQYEMLTNDTIQLFLDRDDMEWGDEWQAKVDGSLASVAFFVPILTPRYFASAACRGELNTFARRATDLGVGQLLMPILYMDFPGIDDETPTDDLVALVRRFQWVDWRELRWAEPDSADYRRAVALLAKRLVDANKAAEESTVSDVAIQLAKSVDEEAGTIELLAAFETALPELTATTEGIATAIEEVVVVATEVSQRSDLQRQTFAQRLQTMRIFATGLAAPAERISKLGDDFTSQLHDVDLGIRAVIERAAQEPENREEFCKFFASIRSMVDSAETGLGALDGLKQTFEPLEKLSRDIRPPLREIRRGVTLLMEGRDVMRPWVELIDATGIDCAPFD